MKRIVIPLVAISGFLSILLGFSSEIDVVAGGSEHHGDSISLSSAQAEKASTEGAAPEASPTPSAAGAASAKDEVDFEKGAGGNSDSASTAPAVNGEECLPAQALTDMNQRKKSLDDREAALAAREQEIANREKAVEERLKEVQAQRAELEKVQAERTKEHEEKVARTVEILESMTPKAASQLISTTDEKLAVEAIGRMSTAKVSKIMNLMDPKRSVRLMELLAGSGGAASKPTESAPDNRPKKEEKL
jgi:flagellar motility protein MotE (MotC chaperone)